MPTIEEAWSKPTRSGAPICPNPKAETRDLFAKIALAKTETQKIRLRQKIALANQGLVVKEATQYSNVSKTPLDDLIGLANIGLMKAILRFDPSLKNAFSSFAVPYIVGEMKHFERDNRTIFKVSRQWVELSDSVRATHLRLQKDPTVNPKPTLEEVASKAYGLTRVKWRMIFDATRSQTTPSLEESEIIVAAHRESLEEAEEKARRQKFARRLVGKLGEPERSVIIEKIWGNLHDREIAKRHGLTVAQVAQITDKAISKMREKVYAGNTTKAV